MFSLEWSWFWSRSCVYVCCVRLWSGVSHCLSYFYDHRKLFNNPIKQIMNQSSFLVATTSIRTSIIRDQVLAIVANIKTLLQTQQVDCVKLTMYPIFMIKKLLMKCFCQIKNLTCKRVGCLNRCLEENRILKSGSQTQLFQCSDNLFLFRNITHDCWLSKDRFAIMFKILLLTSIILLINYEAEARILKVQHYSKMDEITVNA
jgi:hypothetical protein